MGTLLRNAAAKYRRCCKVKGYFFFWKNIACRDKGSRVTRYISKVKLTALEHDLVCSGPLNYSLMMIGFWRKFYLPSTLCHLLRHTREGCPGRKSDPCQTWDYWCNQQVPTGYQREQGKISIERTLYRRNFCSYEVFLLFML